MLVIPTLVLPRDNELETLGRTVEQALGRSVESIDVIGRGKGVSLLSSVLLAIGPLTFFFAHSPFP